MRILITTFTYPPNKDGVAEACRMMAEGLLNTGWEVWVATNMKPHHDTGVRIWDMGGIKLACFNLTGKPPGPPSNHHSGDHFMDFVRYGNFDLVVNQCWDTRIARYLHENRCHLSIPLVMVSHGYGGHIMQWQRNPLRGWGVWLRGLYFTAFTLPAMIGSHQSVIFLSNRMDWGRFFDHRLARWLGHGGIHVVANAIDLDQFPQDDRGFRDNHDIGNRPMVLCVANYSERKNQKLAIQAFRKANVPDSVLVLIGSEFNEYSHEAMALDSSLSLKQDSCRVIFLEKLSRQETFAAYVACDTFLLAAKAETQPIVLIEAMAAGKPWISTDTGCVSEMVGGLVCQSEKQLVTAIREMLANRDIRNKLVTEGRKSATTSHDAHMAAAQYDSIFRSLVQKHSNTQ